MATRRLSGIASSSSVPDNGGDHSGGGGGSAGGYVDGVFSTYVYKGTGAARDIENGVDLAGEGGMVWIKTRDSSIQNHALFDTERGPRYHLASNADVISIDFGAYGVDSFNSNGFSLIGNGAGTNGTDNYVSWTFRKAKNFFDVVMYTGDGVAGREIPHNLGSTPGMIIVKNVSTQFNWQVYHCGTDAVAPEDYYLQLDRPNAREVDTGNGRWGGAAPTEQAFTVGNSPATNESGSEHIAYVFAHDDSDESIIKCGSYTGDGTSDLSKEINLGWEPQFLMIKPASYSGDGWFMFDTMRGIVAGGNEARLYANDAGSENAFNNYLVLTSTGFAFDREALNTSSAEYIYIAIRRPTKHASEFEPEELFNFDGYSGTSGTLDPAIEFPFDTDMFMLKRTDATGDMNVFSRLVEYPTTGKSVSLSGLVTSSTAGDSDKWTFRSSDAKDIAIAQDNSSNLNVSGGTYIYYGFRRVPGFFDVVAWPGDGVDGRSLPHNLGVTPEFAIIKRRRGGTNWLCRHSGLNENQFIWLDENTAAQTATSGGPNGEAFAMDDRELTFNNEWGPYTNFNNEFYIAYLFASVPGISKVGSYTGDGGTQFIETGFPVHFLLIKRVDAPGNWILLDRGQGSPGVWGALALNSGAAQVIADFWTYTPDAFGVVNDSRAGDEYNTNIDGAQYIYYVIGQ